MPVSLRQRGVRRTRHRNRGKPPDVLEAPTDGDEAEENSELHGTPQACTKRVRYLSVSEDMHVCDGSFVVSALTQKCFLHVMYFCMLSDVVTNDQSSAARSLFRLLATCVAVPGLRVVFYYLGILGNGLCPRYAVCRGAEYMENDCVQLQSKSKRRA